MRDRGWVAGQGFLNNLIDNPLNFKLVIINLKP